MQLYNHPYPVSFWAPWASPTPPPCSTCSAASTPAPPRNTCGWWGGRRGWLHMDSPDKPYQIHTFPHAEKKEPIYLISQAGALRPESGSASFRLAGSRIPRPQALPRHIRSRGFRFSSASCTSRVRSPRVSWLHFSRSPGTRRRLGNRSGSEAG